MPSVASKSAFVNPAFIATANPWQTAHTSEKTAELEMESINLGKGLNLHNFGRILSTHVQTKNFVCLCTGCKFHEINHEAQIEWPSMA